MLFYGNFMKFSVDEKKKKQPHYSCKDCILI